MTFNKINHDQFVILVISIITGFWSFFAQKLIWDSDPQLERFLVFGISLFILILSYTNDFVSKNLETINLFLSSIFMGHFLTIVYRSQSGGLVIFYSYLLGAATALMALAFAFKRNSYQKIISLVVFLELIVLLFSIESEIMPKAVGINIFAVFSAFYINYQKNKTMLTLDIERSNLNLLLENSLDKYLIFDDNKNIVYKDTLITKNIIDDILKNTQLKTVPMNGIEYEIEHIHNKSYHLIYFKDYSSIKDNALKRSQITYQNQNLLEIKRMTSCISHEINNPLSAIELSIDMLQENSEPKIELEVIKSSIKKIQNLSLDLAKFNEEFTGEFEDLFQFGIQEKFIKKGFQVTYDPYSLDHFRFNNDLLDLLVSGLSMIIEKKNIILVLKGTSLEIVLNDPKISTSDDIFRPFNFKRDNIQNNNRFSMSLTKDKINKAGFNIIFFGLEKKIIITPKI